MSRPRHLTQFGPRVTRRNVLTTLAFAASSLALAACGQATPAPSGQTPAEPAKPSTGAKVQPTAVPPAAAKPTATGAAPTATGAAPTAAAKPTIATTPKGGTLRIAQTANPRSFNPARQLEFWSWGGLYDSPIRYGADGSLLPHLAESFTVSEDGSSVTLKLRSGVKFHSGREFTSEDVAWMIEKIKEPQAGALFRTFAVAISKIQRPDKQTIILTMDKPEAGILDLLGNLYIPDKTIDADLDRKGSGTGPFEFVEFVPGDRIVFKRNESYWGQKAALDRIEVKIFGDPQASVANLEAGTIDVTGVNLQDFVRLSETGKYSMVKIVGATMFNVWLNTKRKPFDNKKVRQGFAYAIDRERFVRTILQNQSKPTNNPLPDYHWAFFPELDNVYEFNLDKAKSLFAEAGYPNGFEASINANSQSRESMGLAQIIQADLAKINVKLTIDAKDSPRWAEASDRSEFDINMHTYGRTNADPSLLFKGTVAWRPENNPMGVDDPKYRELVDAQSVVIDREKRKPLLKQLVEYVQDQCFVIPVAGSVTAYAMNPKVQGLTLLPVGIVAYMEKVSLT